jgi:hypothetical protein
MNIKAPTTRWNIITTEKNKALINANFNRSSLRDLNIKRKVKFDRMSPILKGYHRKWNVEPKKDPKEITYIATANNANFSLSNK